MKFIWLIILICLISIMSGCSGNPISNNGFKDSLISDDTFVRIRFYDDLDEVRKHCGEDAVACVKCNDTHSHCQFHSVKEYECALHEFDHILFGNFHKGRNASCLARK